MSQLIPYRFVVKVYPEKTHPQSNIIGWTYANAIVFDGSVENAVARLYAYLRNSHWEIVKTECAFEMPLSRLADLGAAEYALYQRAVQQGFAVDFHANPKDTPDPGSFWD